MDQQKIDRLFREKLDSYEAVPSAQAWAEVEKRIGAKSNPSKFYMIAAAISLLIICWVVWPQKPITDLTPISGDVNHPVMLDGPEWSIPVVAKETKKEPQAKSALPVQQKTQLVAQEPAKNDPILDVNELEKAPELDLEKETVVADAESQIEKVHEVAKVVEPIEVANESADEMMKIDLSKVKITYIASEEDKKQESDSVGAFKKIIAFAGKISPGEVLADIKTAKDDFISGGFKSKAKDKTSP